MPDRSLVDADGLAALAREILPTCFLHEAVGDAAKSSQERLPRYFGYLTNIPTFGERLVLLTGLALNALYVDAAFGGNERSQRDDLLDDHLRRLLFDRGADLGLVCATIQRIGILQGGPISDLVSDDRPVTSFVLFRPTSAGNFFRGQLTHPIENQLHDLMERLRFLREFRFEPTGEITFRNVPVEVRPFLRWDGRHLWRFRSLERGEEPTITWQRCEEGTDVQETVPTRSLDVERIRRIAIQLDVPRSVFDGSVTLESEALPGSLLPLFTDCHPAMTRLVQQIWLKSEHSTRVKLWTQPCLKDRLKAEEMAKNEVFVTSEIVRQCLEKDPVTVLEEYFLKEPNDQHEYFEWLIQDPGEARLAFQAIQIACDKHQRKLAAYYCRADDRALDNKVSAYQARKTAMRVVELLGFPVVPRSELNDAAEFRRRLTALHQYLLEDDWRDASDAHAKAGLLEAAVDFEDLLKSLVIFYEAVKAFDLRYPTGLDDDATQHLGELRKSIRSMGLGQVIGKFRDLGMKDQTLSQKLQQVAGRESLWPSGSQSPHFSALQSLNEWRIRTAHSGHAPSTEDPRELTGRLLSALDWLIRPGGRDVSTHWRVFPAHLTLNLVTQNSCGICSVRYLLVQQEAPHTEITLYTEQKLAVETGSLLGLPHLGKAQKNLWVNPVLIAASVVSLDEP